MKREYRRTRWLAWLLTAALLLGSVPAEGIAAPEQDALPTESVEDSQDPDGGQEPEGGQESGDGQEPEGGQTPGGGQEPEGGQTPGGGQEPEGGQTPDGGQEPGGEELPQQAVLSGTVTGRDGLPVAGAKVTAGEWWAETDGQGYFSLAVDVSETGYTLTVEATEEYAPYQMDTGAVQENREFTCALEVRTFSVTLEQPASGEGILTADNPGPAEYGGSRTVTVTAQEGWMIQEVQVNGSASDLVQYDPARRSGTLELTDIRQETTVQAVFAKITNTAVLSFDSQGTLLNPLALFQLKGAQASYQYDQQAGEGVLTLILEKGTYLSRKEGENLAFSESFAGRTDGGEQVTLRLQLQTPDPAVEPNPAYTLTLATDQEDQLPVISNLAGTQEEGGAWNGTWLGSGYTITFQAADPDSGIRSVVYGPSGQVGTTATVQADGSVSLAIPSQSYQGTYWIQVTDRAGNVQRMTVPVYIDTQAPEITAIRSSAGDSWSSQDVTVTVEVEKNLADVEGVYYSTSPDFSQEQQAQRQADGSYQFTVAAADWSGSYYIRAKSTAGVASAASTVALKMDVTEPTVDAVQSDASGWTNRDITLTITVSDDDAAVNSGVERVYVYVDNFWGNPQQHEAVKTGENTYQYTVRRGLLSFRDKEYHIRAVDAAGNLSAYWDGTASIDVESPEITGEIQIGVAEGTLQVQEDGVYTNRPVQVTVAAQDEENGSGVASIALYRREGGSYVELSPAQAVDEDGRAVFIIPQEELAAGALAFQGVIYARVMDNAGNLSDYQASVRVTLEDTAPSASIALAEEPDWTLTLDGQEYACFQNDTELVIAAQDTDGTVNAGVWKLQVSINGTVVAQEEYTAGAGDTRTVQVSTQGVELAADGSYRVEALATDFAGNQWTETFVFYRDVTAPSIGAVEKAPAADWTTQLVQVNILQVEDAGDGCQAGVRRVLYSTENDPETAQEASQAEEGSYFFQVDEECDVRYYIWAEDQVGNISEASQIPVRIDRTAPAITAITFSGDGYSDRAGEALAPVVEETEYGFFFREAATVTVTATDSFPDTTGATIPSSGIAMIYYYTENAYGRRMLEGSAQPDENGSISFSVEEGFQGQIYALAVDNLGNRLPDDPETDEVDEGYVHNGGLMVETAELHQWYSGAEITLPETENRDNDGNPLYAQDITAGLTVSDTYSGLRTVEWSVEAPYDTEQDQSGTLQIEADGTLSGDTEGWSVVESSQNLVTELHREIGASHNSNGIVLTLTLTDRAGFVTTVTETISIDKTNPSFTVTFDNHSYNEAYASEAQYYQEPRVATVVVTERNFANACALLNITDRDGGTGPYFSAWQVEEDLEDPDQTTYTATLTFDFDGNYDFQMGIMDLAGNRGADYEGTSFVIDRTAPMVNVTYSGEGTGFGYYFNQDRTATITVEEHNFDPSQFQLSGTGVFEGAAVAYPGISGWSSSGDTHTATVTFRADGVYTLDVAYMDKAGNAASDYPGDEFVMDQTAPELAISGVEDQSANPGTVAPVIRWSDVNAGEAASITLTGANRGEVELDGEFSVGEQGGSYTFYDMAYERICDDLYTLTARVEDLAGNVTEQTIYFSVNRFGSVYSFSPEVTAIDGQYIRQEQEVVLTETNVDSLEPESIWVRVTQNGVTRDLEEGSGYQLEVTGGSGSWSQYTYRIGAEQFAGEGTYVVTVTSRDAAGNLNETSDAAKRAEIRFGVDKTAPVAVPINLDSGVTYPEDSKVVQVDVRDNLKLDQVEIYLNGAAAPTWMENGQYCFQLGSSDSPQAVEIVASDMAGNTLRQQVGGFYVTTNLYIRWLNNRPLFAGTIAAAVILVCGISAGVVIRVRRKRRRRQ